MIHNISPQEQTIQPYSLHYNTSDHPLYIDRVLVSYE